jgi:hypothetical protein
MMRGCGRARTGLKRQLPGCDRERVQGMGGESRG